jgi:hypothetical protein
METSELIDTIDQVDFTDICRVFYPAAAQYTFFLAAHGMNFLQNISYARTQSKS